MRKLQHVLVCCKGCCLSAEEVAARAGSVRLFRTLSTMCRQDVVAAGRCEGASWTSRHVQELAHSGRCAPLAPALIYAGLCHAF
jgi:hypothetical protein